MNVSRSAIASSSASSDRLYNEPSTSALNIRTASQGLRPAGDLRSLSGFRHTASSRGRNFSHGTSSPISARCLPRLPLPLQPAPAVLGRHVRKAPLPRRSRLRHRTILLPFPPASNPHAPKAPQHHQTSHRTRALSAPPTNYSRTVSVGFFEAPTYVEHVQSSIAAMRKQLAHLTPSLRYLRERRERIEVFTWARDLSTFHNDNFDKKGVRVVVVRDGTNGFVVNMNRGKLTQILDNLILNAEYWLREAVSADLLLTGEITITVDTPFLRVMDNGKGVEESVEESLFDPFVTTKRIGEGRGLGLFVVRQLLDSESCSITLLDDRNAYGRRYVFELDFSGAING